MKLLIETRDREEQHRLVEVLAQDHRVAVVDGGESVRAACVRVRPDLVLIDADRAPELAGLTPRIAHIALVANCPAAPYVQAFDAGAVDVLRIGAGKEEVLGRIAQLRRARVPMLPSITMRINAVKVWKDLERIVASELGDLLGTSLHPAEAEGEQPLVHTSVIPLTLVSQHLLVKLGIGVDENTRAQLVDVLLGGEDNKEAVLDALREMANTAGGAIRRAALDDGVSFSIGLPSNENLFAADGRRRVWRVSDDNGLALECTVTLSSNHPERVPLTELREGMVLAREVIGDDGLVIASAGTCLTQTTIDQIAALMDPSVEIEAA